MTEDELDRTYTGLDIGKVRPFLVVLESPTVGELTRTIPLDGQLSIGRSSDADAVIKDNGLSRRHAAIMPAGPTWRIHDLGSLNGTWVNGAKIETMELRSGDQIRVGSTLLQFHDARINNVDLRQSLAESGIALWEYLSSTQELAFSEHVDHALGLPPSTLGRKRLAIADCIDAEHRARLEAALARPTEPLEVELLLKISPQLERWVLLRGVRDGRRSPGAIGGSIVDVTILKRREATLARSALIFERFLDGVALTDQSGTLVDVNTAMAKLLGVDRSRLIGRYLFSVVPAEDLERQWQSATAGNTELGRFTTSIQLSTTPAIHLDVLAFPLRTDRDEEAGIAWVFRDVSEKQRMASQIAFLDRLAALGTLSAGVAHEINNPLTFMLSNMEFVRESMGRTSDRTLVEAIDEVIGGIHRIGSIVRDLNVFSRANPGDVLAAIDPCAAIERALKMTAPVLRARAQVVKELRAVRFVEANEPRVVQVLVNLLVNAAEALAGAPPRDATITVRSFDDARGVTIEVIDTGKGLTPEVATRAFEPFFTTKPLHGTGLGLSICHGLIAEMGGTITLKSNPGGGAVARIWLPAAARAESSTAPLEPVVLVEKKRLRILIIDDEPILLRATSRILREHEVVTADGFVSASACLLERRESFDAILCDLMMPDGTGMELHAKLLVERPEILPHMIFMTGAAFTDDARTFLQSLDAQQIRHLEKPIETKVLREIVVETAGRASSRG